MNTAESTLPTPNRMPGENVAALRQHLQQCRRSGWYDAAAMAQRLHGVVAPRFVSTVALAVVILGLASRWV